MKKRIVALVLAVLTLVLALGFAKRTIRPIGTTSQIRASWSSELLTSDP